MARYLFRLAGREDEHPTVDCGTVEEARNAAVRWLGNYLAEHPGFANEGHWRVEVEDASGQAILNVIVATVTPHNSPLRGS